MKSAEEIRDYLIELLNNALLRLSMYGDESIAMHFSSALAFIDEREPEWEACLSDLKARGALRARGVSGAFHEVTHQWATDNEIASVFAEIAFKMGYLKTDRLLDRDEFESLRSGLRSTCRSRDFTMEEVLAEFGAPSWISGTKPYSSCVFVYFCREPDSGSLSFDFWNELDRGTVADKVCGKFGDLPVLRDVRIRGATFAREFTFTPLGRKITGRK